jgi:hypothetical protein
MSPLAISSLVRIISALNIIGVVPVVPEAGEIRTSSRAKAAPACEHTKIRLRQIIRGVMLIGIA